MALSVEDRAAGAVDVILKDGGTLRLRPPGRGRRRRAARVLRGLSERSLYLRFHGIRRVDAELVEPLLDPDWAERGALAGWLGDRIVGIANYVRLRDPASAEAAFAVADDEQGRGIGTRLLEQLAARAPSAGVDPLRRRGAGREPGDARRLHRGRLRRRARARARRGRGRFPLAADRDVPGARRGARPRRRRRVAAARSSSRRASP